MLLHGHKQMLNSRNVGLANCTVCLLLKKPVHQSQHLISCSYLLFANSQQETLGNSPFLSCLKYFPGRFFPTTTAYPIVSYSLPHLPKLSRQSTWYAFLYEKAILMWTRCYKVKFTICSIQKKKYSPLWEQIYFLKFAKHFQPDLSNVLIQTMNVN